MTHSDLVNRAYRWLRKTKGCSIAFTEMATATGEIPDAIGWRYSWSYLVECKASRSDFLCDRDKVWREFPEQGMGSERWYMTTPRLLKPEEVPYGWGLLECGERQVREVLRAKRLEMWNQNNEIAFLCSMLRRVAVRAGDLNEYISRQPAGERE